MYPTLSHFNVLMFFFLPCVLISLSLLTSNNLQQFYIRISLSLSIYIWNLNYLIILYEILNDITYFKMCSKYVVSFVFCRHLHFSLNTLWFILLNQILKCYHFDFQLTNLIQEA